MSHDQNFYVAHNQFYEQVLVPKRPELMGKMFRVKIVDSCKFSMTGALLDEASVTRPSPAEALQPGQLSGAGDLVTSASSGGGGSDNNQLYVQSFYVLILAAFIRLLYLLWNW